MEKKEAGGPILPFDLGLFFTWKQGGFPYMIPSGKRTGQKFPTKKERISV